jgi:hypothetical protein
MARDVLARILSITLISAVYDACLCLSYTCWLFHWLSAWTVPPNVSFWMPSNASVCLDSLTISWNLAASSSHWSIFSLLYCISAAAFSSLCSLWLYDVIVQVAYNQCKHIHYYACIVNVCAHEYISTCKLILSYIYIHIYIS